MPLRKEEKDEILSMVSRPTMSPSNTVERLVRVQMGEPPLFTSYPPGGVR